MWRFVRHRLNNLDQRFQNLKQELYAVLYGRQQQPERWKYCISYVNGNMGMAVGSLFVRHFFSEESKNDVRMSCGFSVNYINLFLTLSFLHRCAGETDDAAHLRNAGRFQFYAAFCRMD